MSRSVLLAFCALAFASGLVWVVSYGLPFGESVAVLLSPLVLAALSWRWGR